MKKDIKEVIAEEVPTVKEYDGYEDLVEPHIDGTYKTTRVKLYLSDSEVKKLLGDIDPSKYFRLGKIPNHIPKSLGTLLPDDRMETIVKNDVFSQFPDVLMFKHDLSNIYTLLIPKVISDFELNKDGDYTDRLVQFDTRSIAFNGGNGRPTSFEADYFKKTCNGNTKSTGILTLLKNRAEARKTY